MEVKKTKSKRWRFITGESAWGIFIVLGLDDVEINELYKNEKFFFLLKRKKNKNRTKKKRNLNIWNFARKSKCEKKKLTLIKLFFFYLTLEILGNYFKFRNKKNTPTSTENLVFYFLKYFIPHGVWGGYAKQTKKKIISLLFQRSKEK